MHLPDWPYITRDRPLLSRSFSAGPANPINALGRHLIFRLSVTIEVLFTVSQNANAVLSKRSLSRFCRQRLAPIALTMLVVAASGGCRMFSHSDNLAGVQLYQQGNFDGAAQRFQQAVATSPQHADGYYNLAATHHRKWKVRSHPQDLQAADMLYNKCLDLDAEHRECYRGLAVLLVEKGEPDAAFRLVNNWARRSIAPAEAMVELSRLYTEFNDPEEAQKRIEEAIEIDPHNHRALNARGLAMEQAGDYQQAMVNYARSLESNRFQPNVSQRVASLQGAAGSIPTMMMPGTGTRVVSMPNALPRY